MSIEFADMKMKLGFGLMRLPKNEDGTIDVEQTKKMVDLFVEAGGTYFDTAFAYPGSEEAIKEALVKRYPRESYTLASKCIATGSNINNEEDAKNEIKVSLERSGAGYFDYYLLHAIQRTNVDLYDKYHLWDYVKELKEKGLIRHYGFSFHADPLLLEELLQKHPDVEFVQLQVNYADWENPGVEAKKNVELCHKYGKPVIVMEPVKGGILADPYPVVKAVFDGENTNYSYAAWALRYVASKEEINVVLSGMSSLAQMEDNLSSMKDMVPLSEHEEEVIRKAQDAFDSVKMIECTGCHYCTKGCPMNVAIPEIFTVQNRKEGSPEFRTKREYLIVTLNKGKASDCIECGQCESACPQHLPIISLLKDCRSLED